MALSRRGKVIVAAAAAAELAGLVVGGGNPGRVVVRCRHGHLFATIWIPLASIKALRLGPWRLQRCPVGRHWSLVQPVRPGSLSEDELRRAQAVRDWPIP